MMAASSVRYLPKSVAQPWTSISYELKVAWKISKAAVATPGVSLHAEGVACSAALLKTWFPQFAGSAVDS